MHVHVTGRCILLFFSILAYGGYAYGSVQLSLTTSRGTVCSRIGVGSVCTVKIVCQGHGPLSFPTVTGLNAFRIEGRSKTMSTVNGVTITTYMYQARALHEGSYTIGPTYVTLNGTVQTSNTVKLEVSDKYEEEHHETSVPALLVRLHADMKAVVVGQTVHGTLSLYYRADMGQAMLDHLETPQWPELGIQVEQQHTQNKECLNGTEYVVYRWHWKVVPQQVGPIVIPACVASCRIAKSDYDDDLFHGMNAFFGGFKQQRIASNSLRIMVHELPASSHTVDAIGTFTSMQAQVRDSSIKRQDATTLCITITGNECVEMYSLHTMPDAVRWYDAKKNIIHDKQHDVTMTSFEFVLQGMHEGTWIIPAQKLHYFDPTDNTYKELATQPISLMVTPGSCNVQQQNTLEHEDEMLSSPSTQPSFLWETEWSNCGESRVLPWSFFFFFLGSSLLIYVFYWYKNRICQNAPRAINKRRAVQQAKKALHMAYKIGNASQVYTIFVQLWAHSLGTSVAHVDQDCLLDTMQATEVSDEKKNEWRKFVTRMMSMAYADYTLHDAHFFKEALTWLDYVAPYL